MSFEHCHFCEPPTRYPGCQDHCPHYAADISALRAAKEEKRRLTATRNATGYARANSKRGAISA